MARVSDLIVRALKKAGVRHIFGIPSIHNIGFYDALREEPSIRHILCRQEACATHMADGYARAGKGVGVVVTSTGPGACYMAAPLVEAWGSLSPVLAVTTNVATDKIGIGTGTLHELKEQDLIFKNITKERFCPRTGEEVLTMIPRAWQKALSGRTGPVYFEVLTDLWDREVSGSDEGSPLPETASTIEPWLEDLDRAVGILGETERPVIVAGSGAVRAGIGAEIQALAEALRAPLVTNTEGKGLLPEDHDLAFGHAARRGAVRELLKTSTVALAIGTRLRSVDYQRRGVFLPRLIHIDWDETWIGRNYPTELAILGDIRTIARRLTEKIVTGAVGRGKRTGPVSTLRERIREERRAIAQQGPEMEYLDVLRRVIPRDGSLVIDNTLLGYWAEYFYQSFRPGGLMAAKGSSIIGFSFPAAMGLKIACPERPVVAVIGDGGFLYGAQEMATCRRQGLGFPVVVLNNGSYGIIDLLQRQFYGRGDFETDLLNPDLPALAAAFGIGAERVATPQGLERALQSALASKEMRVIELEAAFRDPFALK
ncbi:MAG: thiamine pyrophosphate-binding protein [Deltaproteobacteria bacterium]|nr:thiamine pyrophosphate-binding protein [Deltaproteobacteria bacterium]